MSDFKDYILRCKKADEEYAQAEGRRYHALRTQSEERARAGFGPGSRKAQDLDAMNKFQEKLDKRIPIPTIGQRPELKFCGRHFEWQYFFIEGEFDSSTILAITEFYAGALREAASRQK